MHQLEGEFRSVISALRSKLDSRAAPPILHLDTVYLQDKSPDSSSSSSPGAPVHSDPSSPQESQQPWSLLTALMSEIQKIRTQDETEAEDSAQTETSPDGEWSTTSEDFTFDGNRDKAESPSSAESTTAAQPDSEGDRTETTTDPRPTVHALKTPSLHRKYRSLLRKRQASGKGV